MWMNNFDLLVVSRSPSRFVRLGIGGLTSCVHSLSHGDADQNPALIREYIESLFVALNPLCKTIHWCPIQLWIVLHRSIDRG